tara:strand:+ start:291 stop:539 length:249 start_codon:yes stop_codon:yes gene_type:complete
MPAEPSFWQLATGDGTPARACKVALVVGTALAIINQGDLVLSGGTPPAWKLILTYIVPYCVATWGAVTTKRSFLRAARQERA